MAKQIFSLVHTATVSLPPSDVTFKQAGKVLKEGGERSLGLRLMRTKYMAIEKPPEEEKKGTFGWLSYESFGIVATVVGFIVDSIAIVSLLLAIRLDLPITLNAFHALFIWCIAVFTYFCLLQIYWRRKRVELDSLPFRRFVFVYLPGNELLLLLPFVVALLLLVWILAEIWMGATKGMSDYDWFYFFWLLIMLGGILLVIAAFIGSAMHRQGFVNKLSTDWKSWDKLVTARLQDHQWVSPSSFEDIQKQYVVEPDEIGALLARYASHHPQTMRYGRVRLKSSGEFVTNVNVLINLRALDRSKYIY